LIGTPTVSALPAKNAIKSLSINRRMSNGEQTRAVAHLAMKRGPSVDFSGCWQRHIKAA